MTNTEILRDTQIVVDLNKLAGNITKIKEMVGADVDIMPVIKANGYGHGACAIAQTLMDCGASALAVATLTEALELKEAYPDYPVLIMGYTPDRLLHWVVEKDIIQTIWSIEQAEKLGQLAGSLDKTACVHIKVDTGFHRLGKCPSDEFAAEISDIFKVPHLAVQGIFSHLALAGLSEDEEQYQQFTDFIKKLEAIGCKFRYKHIADSIACVDYPQYRMNLVRPGALLYGMKGAQYADINVEQILTFKTAISQLHEIPAGEGLSYDYLWKAERDSIIATLPFGYADGYPRNLRDKGYVIINGARAPIVGVICMDQCMADVTDVPDVCCGMEAIIYGDGKDGSMTIAEAASLSGTNKNDIIARLTARPPRVYIGK
ncbi:alanine racemase [Emergencia sp. JLR.KK010]|uniref:alanine racemase n=1 Tax=Emergencia sp. JLR.KK010 TaxID=3114296 RepID=UPI0030CCEB74